MININRINNYNKNYYCYPEEYEFSTKNTKILFQQLGSGDLVFSVASTEYKKEVELEITEDYDYLLYRLVNKLYYSLTTGKFLNYKEDRVDAFDFKELYDGEKISWKSDAPINELENVKEFKYNYLNIYKKNNKYIFKFINNSNDNLFHVEFNTDRSRYERFVFPFIIFFKDLKEITEEYRQLDLDEYIHYEKIKKRG